MTTKGMHLTVFCYIQCKVALYIAKQQLNNFIESINLNNLIFIYLFLYLNENITLSICTMAIDT